jgi:hypothetical protein
MRRAWLLIRVLALVAVLAVGAVVGAIFILDRQARDAGEVRVIEVPFIRPGVGAVTAGRIIFVHRGRADDSDLIAHELVHVCQWEDQGIEFLWEYTSEYLRNLVESGDPGEAYREISFEQEASTGEIECDLEQYLLREEPANINE